MADNAFVKIGTALLKHQVKKLVGEEALGAIGEELTELGGDRLDAWLNDKSTTAEIDKAAMTARDLFRGKVNDDEIEQWMVMLPIHDLPAVLSAIEELPKSPDETKLENALRETIALNWKRLSPEQVNNAVNAFMSCLRSALLPIEKQTLMVIGRSVLRTEDKVERLLKLVEHLQAARLQAVEKVKGQLNTGWFYGHRYGDLAAFTGRTAELKMLDEWLANDRDNLLMLRALGGFGKSALTWTWFNSVDRERWQTAVWWSFYEKESGFESFLSETLKHLGMEVKESTRQQVNDLLDVMHKTNILIMLDGFERLLRQYGKMDAALQSDDEDEAIDPSQRDCASPLTETFLRGLSGAGMKSKVLMTTRLCPRVLESADGKLLKGCCEVELTAMSKADAVEFFHKQRIQGRRDEIETLCEKYGYHPLSLSLLVGLINEDHEHRGDIEAVKNLEIFEDVKARRHHVLERAYESLVPERRDLLSKISCFRGSMEYAVLKKVFSSGDLEAALLDLRKRGLLQYAGESQRYDMHPIVRHYAYDHFTDEKRRKEAHVQLVMHFIDVMPVTNKNARKLEDLAPVIELYYHMVKAGDLDGAFGLYITRISDPVHFQFGLYQKIVELLMILFLDGEDKPPHLKDESRRAWTLNELANAYAFNGRPRNALPAYQLAADIYENKIKNIEYLAINISSVAQTVYLPIGALCIAEANQRKSISLAQEIQEENIEFVGRQELGRILAYRSAWQEANIELDISTRYWEKHKDVQGICVNEIYRAQCFLFMARANPRQEIVNLKSSIKCASHALELADKKTQAGIAVSINYIRANWILGAAHRVNGDLINAEKYLSEAVNICRQIGAVLHEAEIIYDLARLLYAQGNSKDAQEKASEALVITERSGYVLQGADVNLFLAQYALEQEKDKVKAKEYAETALKLATCDGPPYYYKVAYEEAERMLERIQKT